MLSVSARLRPMRSARNPKHDAADPRGQQHQGREQAGRGLGHSKIAHDVSQHERVKHGVERVKHPSERSRQQRAALAGCGLLQKLDWADGHEGKDCNREG